MKNHLLLAVFLMTGCSASFGASISVDLSTDTFAVANGNLPVGSGFTARIGVYTGSPLTVISVASDISQHWTEVGQVPFATGAMQGYNGYFSTGQINFSTSGNGLAGADVWIWLTDGGSNNALITGLGTFMSDLSIPNSSAISLSKDNLPNATFALGAYNPNIPNPNGGGAIVMGIPEPSLTAFGAVAAFGLLRRRRS